jgi:hypothetical protein
MPTADQLKSACSAGRSSFPADCSGAVKSIAAQIGYALPQLNANQLVDYFNEPKNGWAAVDETRAQALADTGSLVIAGKKGSPNGHVVVVYPGGKKASGGYAYTDKKTGKSAIAGDHGQYPRACSSSLGGWPGAVSDGDKTVFDSWGSVAGYAGVKYWSAPALTPVAQNLPLIDRVRPGARLVCRVPIWKGRIWEHSAFNQLTCDLPPRSLFTVGSMHIVERWCDLVANNYVPLRLRVSAQELAAIFEEAT